MATLRPPSWSGRCLKRAALADAFEGQENRFGPADNGGGCPAPGRNGMLTRSSIRIHHTRCGLFLYALIESDTAPWRCFWSSVDVGGYRSEERRRGLKVRPAAMGLGAISCTQRHHMSAPSTPKTGAAWGHANVRPRFRSTILAVEVLRSALRHDVEPEDIQHVVRNAVVVEEIAEDPDRYLLLGADRAGRFLELVVMDRPQGPAVIHAMPMRAKYRTLLQKGR